MLIQIFSAFFAIVLIATFWKDFALAIGLGAALLFIAVLVANGWNNAMEPVRAEKAKKLRELAKPILEAHKSEISRKKRQFVLEIGYGIKDTKKWNAEKQFFLKNVLLPALGTQVSAEDTEFLLSIIEEAASDSGTAAPNFETAGKPIEYEDFCAETLRMLGWQVNLTKTTGDQGADIIANKYGKSVVIQCKLYNSPVGNKAVQEAYTAKSYYETDAAAVVTNSTFTRAAKELANTTGVLLLHHEQLSEL